MTDIQIQISACARTTNALSNAFVAVVIVVVVMQIKQQQYQKKAQMHNNRV